MRDLFSQGGDIFVRRLPRHWRLNMLISISA